MVWLTGVALTLSIALIVGLLGLIFVQGLSTFWPKPIELLTLRDGGLVAGLPVAEESYSPNKDEAAEIEALRAARSLRDGSLDAEGAPVRRLLRTGNRDVGNEGFRWVPLWRVASVDRPEDLVLVEREEWGVWVGRLRGVITEDDPEPSGEGFEERWSASRGLMSQAESISRGELGRINAELNRSRLKIRRAEIALERAGERNGMAGGLWALTLAGFAVSVVAWVAGKRAGRPMVRHVAMACALLLGLAGALEHPWAGSSMTEERLAEITAQAGAEQAELAASAEAVELEIRGLRERALEARVVLTDVTGERVAPDRSGGAEHMPLASVVRMVRGNDLSFAGKLGVFIDRWVEFLTDRPRASNTEGGVMPVIFGTVALTLLLSVAVVPLGVIAALYLREYATQGVITSILRISVNNLAGVPSIVYGVFGLGFFCYTLGGFVDGGSESPLVRWGMLGWWPLAIVAVLLASSGLAVGTLARSGGNRNGVWLKRTGVACWVVCVTLIGALVLKSPYFGGLFPEKLPTPTYGGRGLLWASLTLALLTLPVVIVATEEAIAAVPGSMREGSYGCGASKWQTIRRIVLPAAAPGVMTGAILAMARGAGEVAPLMIVGAVKSAPELPVSGEFPFVHFERSFMHLGFHIYDLGFQSPDSAAARPMVWTTTLLLIALVVVLNLVAIMIRARLRSRLRLNVA